jgi:cephalosporin hydroxylase
MNLPQRAYRRLRGFPGLRPVRALGRRRYGPPAEKPSSLPTQQKEESGVDWPRDIASLPGGERTARLLADFEGLMFLRSDRFMDNTSWLGAKVRKLPFDLWVLQEILWETRPDLVIETGVFHGGSTLFYATLFDLFGEGEVIGVDTDLSSVHPSVRSHPRITLIEASSTDPAVVGRISAAARDKRVMVTLDSDHSAAHVLGELAELAPLVSPGCYLVVEDTLIGHPVGSDLLPGPAEALWEWLSEGQPFEIDRSREKWMLTSTPSGYLRRVET